MAKKLIEEDLRMNILVNGDAGKKAALDAAKTFDDLGKKLEKAKKELSAIDAGLRPQGYENAQKKVQALSAAYEKARQRMESLNRQQEIWTMTMGELQRHIKLTSMALKDAIPETDQWKLLNRELAESKARLKELGDGGTQTEGILKRLWGSASGAVAILRTGWILLGRVANGLRGAFNTIKDFEQANVNLATILGKDVGLIFELTNQARELGGTTRYTASEVTGLQTELAKLGFTQQQILQMTGSVLNFATAVGAELPESAALAGATIRMFGLRASETDDVLGTLALSTNKSALNFSYLQTAMSIVGPVARTFGFSVKDTTALLGTLANAGFDASSAATATRNIILNLANANGKLAKALGEPVSTFPELIDGLKKLNDKGVDLTTTLELTDRRSVSAFNAFLSGTESAKALRDELDDTGGVLQEIADNRMNTLEGSLASLKSAWERFVLSMSESKGVIKDVIDLLTGLVRKITPGEDTDTGAIARRTTAYVGSLWNMYFNQENGVDLINQAIADDEKKMEAGLKEAERKLESASGILAKRRAKKEMQYYQEGLAVIAGSRQELSDRLLWNAGGDSSGNGSGNSGGGGDGDGDNDNDNKHKASWSLQSDKTFLAAKAELTRQYNEDEIKSQKEYDEQLYQLEVATLTARLASRKDSSKDRLKIEVDLQNKIMKHKQDAAKEEEKLRKEREKLAEKGRKIVEEEMQAELSAADKKLEAEVKRYEEEKKKFQGNKDALEAIEKKHRRTMMQIRIEAENEAFKNLQSRHELERQQLENQWTARIALAKKGSGEEAELRKKMTEELARMDLVYLESLKATLETIVEAGALDGVYLNDEQILAYQKKLAEVIKQINSVKDAQKSGDAGILSGTGDASLFGVKQSDWETLFQNLKYGTLTAKDLQAAITGIGGAAQEGFKLANQAIQLTNAKEKKDLDEYKKGQDSRKKELEARYKAGLMTEHQYNEEVEQMEADMQAKQEDMELKQARRAKAMSIVESIINTALGVTKTLAQWGVPDGLVPASIMAAMGAAQTAMIIAQPTGYAEGGNVQVKRAQDGRSFRARVDPSKRGYVDRPTILVGEEGGEYVIPAEALKNPDIRLFADAIESARKSGRLRSLRMEAVNPSAVAMSARAEGGYSPASAAIPAGSTVVSSSTVQEIDRLRETVNRLSSILDAGIMAEVVMTGRKGLVRRFEEYNRMKEKGQL